ncbi:uncharacterized protein LOC141528881 [Cotesia typhae]|uniref:uncharacterized protein LOC141528881 n=1 Tax=Cotesia typhae TaxID=2053667 RepID=UPI003D691EB3
MSQNFLRNFSSTWCEKVSEATFAENLVNKLTPTEFISKTCHQLGDKLRQSKKYTLKPNAIPKVNSIQTSGENTNLPINSDNDLQTLQNVPSPPTVRTSEETSNGTPDLNEEVTNIKTNKSTAVTFTLLNEKDFWSLLRELETSSFCDGTGFNSDRSSLTCVNILINQNYRSYQGIIRCKPCRILRHQLQNRDNKSTKNLKVQCDKLKRQLISQKRKTTRLQRKVLFLLMK